MFTLVLPVTSDELTICDSGQMCAARPSEASSCRQKAPHLAMPANIRNSTADEPGRLDSHQYQYSGLGALGTFNFQEDGPHATGGSPTELRPWASPPVVRTAPTKSPSTPDKHRPFPLFADSGNINRSTVNNAHMERAITSGLETGAREGDTTPPAPVASDCTAKISGEGVEESDDWNLQYDRTVPLVEEDSDDDEPHERMRTNAIQVVATQSLLAQRKVEQAGAEPATVLFGMQANASIDLYRGHPHDLDIEGGSGDRQGKLSIPMDEDELEPSFGVSSNTTFDPVLPYHPHLNDHSLSIRQDDLVGEDNSPVDLAMEDAAPEAERAIASATVTKSLQAFSWIPPSASSAFRAIFPGVSSTHTAALVDGSTQVMDSPMLDNPYAVDMAISEGVRLQHPVPPQDIAWPIAPSETQPLPSVELKLFKEPEYFIPRLSPTPVSDIFAIQATSHSTFPPVSPPASRAGPVPVSPSTYGSIEEDEGEVKGLNRGVDSRPAVVVSVRREASPLRCV